MKNMIRVGSRWLNPAHVSLVDATFPPAAPPKLKLHLAGFPHSWDFEGDEAEAVLDALDYGKAAREKEAEHKAKEAEKAERAAAKAAEKAAEKGAAEHAGAA